MANLTDRQRKLLNLLNQMSQNMVTTNSTNNDSTLSHNFALNLPGFSLDGGQNLNLSLGKWGGGGGTPGTPTTIREVLLGLVNEQVQVTTPFDTISGTLLSVQDDYIVIIEASGAQVLVRIEKIEFVSNS
ncbi:DUF2642 domain-containing protein [Oceanobacillus neutriphilus]|uniref:DUF2642 domain-containing protein n=1 Tax=Oceanobacillus neutriphilus TaxID=531815 RepID=A0ABQ2NS06_9BACI|nr:DUF2642 domain-containing protein [Oceanobacillus neutriphilus]GGP09188.1 hypothetical protein GCM10011346_12240 [Oceanobacillus neutriphilus]